MSQEAIKEELADPDLAPEGDKDDKGSRDKSTIQFPYLSLEEAVTITKGVHEVGGNSCQVDQLAAHLKQSPKAGSFRLKLLTAKMFGLITYSLGTVTLTPLGARVCDPQQAEVAKADSFLLIPLYLRVYEQFKGASLPPLAGLEAAMVTMGVAPKQKDTARQVFQRSAQYAGFFWSGAGRLVYPKVKASAGTAPALDATTGDPAGDRDHDRQDRKKNGNDGDGGGYHPFIAGLLKTLPPADSEWSMDARRKWLQAASTIFELIYKDSDSKGSLKIEFQKDGGKL